MTLHTVNKYLISLCLALSLGACLHTEPTESYVDAAHIIDEHKGVTQFVDGDRIVFIGDSITHGGAYHKNIFLFNATRYPHKKIRYYNAGISGDNTGGTIKRFDVDIAIHKPTIASIMLGMNDSGRWLYEKLPVTAEEKSRFMTQQTNIRNTYLQNMETLAQKLTAIGSDIIFIKPSIFDETVALDSNPHIGLNDELANFGEHVAKLAKKYNATVVDFQTPMLEVNKHLQASDPLATIVSNDRVHPGEAGHFVMSYGFLRDQHESTYVSNFQFDAKNAKVEAFSQCELVGNIALSERLVEFTCLGKSLPFPLNKAQMKASQWVPFQQGFNQQFYQVKHLMPGQYQLAIDGRIVGHYSEVELAKGINLAANEKTPMYQQALEVSKLNQLRAQASDEIRTVAHVHYRMLGNVQGLNFADLSAVKVALDAHVEKAKGQPWYGYLKGQAQKYFKVVGSLEENRAEVDRLFDEIYQVNQPKSHHWKLTKIDR